MTDTNRRNFLRGLGATVAGTAASVTGAVPLKVVVKEVVERRVTYEDVLITYGDGTQDGDMAMIKVNGDYRSHVLRNGKWLPAFPR